MADHIWPTIGLAHKNLLRPSPLLRYILILVSETEFFFDVVFVLTVVIVSSLLLILIIVFLIFIILLVFNLLRIVTRNIFLARRLLILLNFAEVVLVAVDEVDRFGDDFAAHVSGVAVAVARPAVTTIMMPVTK